MIHFNNARFEEHTTVTTKNIVLWGLTPYSLVLIYYSCEEMCCLHFCVDAGKVFLPNATKFLLH